MRIQGFTLIDLMITTALLGIVIGIAIPAYQVYWVKERVSEGLALAGSAQLAINAYSKIYKTLPDDPSKLQYTRPPINQNVDSIGVDNNSLITITYKADAGGGTIVLAPALNNGDVTWNCKGGSLEAHYRPDLCK